MKAENVNLQYFECVEITCQLWYVHEFEDVVHADIQLNQVLFVLILLLRNLKYTNRESVIKIVQVFSRQ